MYLCPSRSTWTDTLFSYTTLVRSERRNGDSRRRESARAQIVVAARMIVPPIIVSLEIDGQPVCRSNTETASDSAAVEIVDVEIGSAHVCTPVINALLVCRLLLATNTTHVNTNTSITY